MVAKAMPSLSPNLDLERALQRATGGSMSAVIAVLAEYRAKKIVKDQLRRQGHKVSDYTAAEIKTMAAMWLAMHRDEAVAQAKEMIASGPELTKMYEKEQRQRAKLASNAQSKIEPISMGSAVQMSGAK